MESKIEIAGMQKIDGQKMRFPRGAKERLMQFFVEAPTGYYTLRVSKARKSKSELSPFPPPCARGAFPLLMSRAYFS